MSRVRAQTASPSGAPTSWGRLLAWLGLFVLSGAGGLVFQVVWTRKLALVLGSTVQSAALTSAGFMLGLGLGAYLAGRWSSRLASPLRTFAWLEVGIALLGLAVTTAIGHLGAVAAVLTGPGSLGYRGILVVMALVLVTLPALAMGGTLPLLVAGHTRSSSGLLRVLSFFYAANTLGAASGAFATDFFLVKSLGVGSTAVCAAVLDLAAAGLAFLLVRGEPQPEPCADTETPVTTGRGVYLVLLALSGLCGLGLEIAWTRLLVFFNGTDIYAYSLVLTIYLVGIVVGSLAVAWVPAERQSPRLLAALFLALGLLAWQTVYTLDGVGQWVGTLADSRLPRRILSCVFLVLPSSCLLGAIFPLASSLAHRGPRGSVGQTVGLAYIANTVGSVLGSLSAGFLLLTYLGLQATIQAFGALAFFAAALALAAAGPRPPRVGLLLVWGGLLLVVWRMTPNYLVPFLYDRQGNVLLFAADDHYGAVALAEQGDTAEARRYVNLLVDGYNMAGNNLESQRYTTQLGLLPALLAQRGEDVLMVCLGLGNTLRALESLPSVKRLDCVELSQTVVTAVSHIPEVKSALESPKVRLMIGDGRYFLSTTDRSYDVITAEPPPPTQAGVVNLYTREYYQLCARRLKPGGVVAQWLPVMQMSVFESKTIIAAFQEVFPYTYLYQGARLQLVLLGSKEPLEPSWLELERRFPKESPRLAQLDLAGPAPVLASFLAGPETLRRYASGVPPLTDDRPFLQYYDDDWNPDLHFLLQASAYPAELLGQASLSPAQLGQLGEARQRLNLRNRYFWERWGAPDLDALRRFELARTVLASGQASLYDQVIFGGTPEHREQLLSQPDSWQRDLSLARWCGLVGQEQASRASLASALSKTRVPAEVATLEAWTLVLGESWLSRSEARAIAERLAQEPALSPPLRAELTARFAASPPRQDD